jgi:hypothetical protein
MTQILKSISLLIVVVSFVVSCKKDDTTTVVPLTAVTVNDVLADTIIGVSPITFQPYGAGKFTFYSLETNKIIASADSNSSKWDLAFRGTTIITNGGTSGPALGGSFVYTGLFDDMKEVPVDSTFKVDNATTLGITSGSGKGWYSYNPTANLITPIPGRVLFIRTATGKYAKVEILNYYKGGVTPAVTASDADKTNKQRYYTFRFIYQPNGTKKF